MAATRTTWSALVWEAGLLGALAFIAFVLVVARDGYRLASQPGETGMVGKVVFAVSAVAMLSMVYTNMFHLPEVLVTFFFGASMCAAQFSAGAFAARPDRAELTGPPAPQSPLQLVGNPRLPNAGVSSVFQRL